MAQTVKFADDLWMLSVSVIQFIMVIVPLQPKYNQWLFLLLNHYMDIMLTHYFLCVFFFLFIFKPTN